MSSLTGQQINQSYLGLIKTSDNLGIDGTPKDLQSGDGTGLPMAVATDRINFTDTIDFTNATVLGIGGGSSEPTPALIQRRFDTTGTNIWNFAQPQNGNNYSSSGLLQMFDPRANKRFFTELYAKEITSCVVLVDETTGFDGVMVAELFDVHPETGMPKDVIATTSTFTGQGAAGGWRWYTADFTTTQVTNYEQYYISLTFVSGTTLDGVYSALNPGAQIQRTVELDPNSTPDDNNWPMDYVCSLHEEGTYPGNYVLNASFDYRIDSHNTMLIQ
jgi:hypothetical protein